MKVYQKPLVILLAIGFLTRLLCLLSPMVSNMPSKSAVFIMMARNILLNKAAIWFPRVDLLFNGETAYRFNEFPIVSIFAALVSKIVPVLSIYTSGRLVAIIFFILSAFFFYKIAAYFLSERSALIALFLYMFCPITIVYSHSFQSESLLLCFSLASVAFFIRYLQKEASSICSLIFSAVCLALALVTKPYAALYGALLILLLKASKRPVRKIHVLLFMLVTFLPVFIWYWHGYSVVHTLGNSYSDLSENMAKESHFLLMNPRFYYRAFREMLVFALNPIGLVLCLLGFFLKADKYLRHFLFTWLFLTILKAIAVPSHLIKMDYYLLDIVPPACIFMVLSIEFILKSKETYLNKKIARSAFAALFIFFTLVYAIPPMTTRPEDKSVLKAANRVMALTGKDDFVLVAHNILLLALTERKGRSLILNNEQDGIEQLKGFINQGAKWLVIADKRIWDKSPEFSGYVKERCKIAEETKDYIIIRLFS